MKRRILLWSFGALLCAAVLLLGHGGARKPVGNYVVQVDVMIDTGKAVLQRTYTQPKKMASILQYLRFLKCRGPASVKETGDRIEIRLFYADRTVSTYRLWDYRYFWKGSRWELVDRAQAGLLYPLVLLL